MEVSLMKSWVFGKVQGFFRLGFRVQGLGFRV